MDSSSSTTAIVAGERFDFIRNPQSTDTDSNKLILLATYRPTGEAAIRRSNDPDDSVY
jgi:hypothetical protein